MYAKQHREICAFVFEALRGEQVHVFRTVPVTVGIAEKNGNTIICLSTWTCSTWHVSVAFWRKIPDCVLCVMKITGW